ncbi:MotE family protein [Asticcacaulis tiandongensis]|uniref:MotE family protein n=1 Tax=Asticcacaulis tiandongensis TaxID=2565365 RepID=UPI001127567E|nr:hypothetical protein [Asticcacaulis tiandongensis]
MSNLPRLLPLIAIAVGGVIALRAVSSFEVVPEALKSAVAFAQGRTETPDGDAEATSEAAKEVALSASASEAAPSVDEVASEAAAAVCATSVDELARQAGMSPSELRILQSLGKRRTDLDARQKELDTRENLVAAAEAKLDGRIKQMNGMKGQLQGMLDQATKVADADTLRMIKVYETMKPKDAAKVFESMKDDVRLPIAARMKERSLAAILSYMTPAGARDLTEKLATRMDKAGGIRAELDKMGTAPQTGAPANRPAN